MTRSRAAALAVGAVVLLTGCSGSEPGSSPMAVPDSGSPLHEDEHSAPPIPTATPAGAMAPEALAQQVMRRFIDRTVTAEVWYEQLAEFLSVEAQQAYYGTDPTEVPATTLAAPPVLVEEDEYLATVEQATDAGIYRLLLSRAPDGSWQVERITPPASS